MQSREKVGSLSKHRNGSVRLDERCFSSAHARHVGFRRSALTVTVPREMMCVIWGEVSRCKGTGSCPRITPIDANVEELQRRI